MVSLSNPPAGIIYHGASWDDREIALEGRLYLRYRLADLRDGRIMQTHQLLRDAKFTPAERLETLEAFASAETIEQAVRAVQNLEAQAIAKAVLEAFLGA